jgi:hypothetical protein
VHLHLPYVRLSHLPPAAVLLSVVYTAAIAVALTDPGRNTVAGLVVLAGLTARWAARWRRPGRAPLPVAAAVAGTTTAVDAVLAPDPVPARAAAA